MAKNRVQIPQMGKGEDQLWQKEKPFCGALKTQNQIMHLATFGITGPPLCGNYFLKNENFIWFFIKKIIKKSKTKTDKALKQLPVEYTSSLFPSDRLQ